MSALRKSSLMNATLLVVAGSALVLAAPPSDRIIGVVITSAPGVELQVDGLAAIGNANLVQGARVQTGDAPARIRLSNGTRATLQAASQARVFADHIVLEKGATVVSTKGYRVESQEVQAAATGAGTDLAIARTSPSTLEVRTVHGDAHVLSGSGALLARVNAGSAVSVNSFEKEAAGGKATPAVGTGETKLSSPAVTSIASNAYSPEREKEHGGHGNQGNHGDGDHGDGDHDDHHHHHHRPPVSRP